MYFFETPQKKRYIQVACAVTWCLFGAGPIFGFAALKPTLIDQGIYEDVCYVNSTISSIDQDNSILTSLLSSLAYTPNDFHTDGFISKCTNQDLKLNMMFTVGAALTNVSALIIGRTLDSYGPRICGLIGAFFLLLASLVFINSKSLLSLFDPYLIGYSLMALGGPFAYISSFQLSNAFPEKSGLILALLTGAFDTSSAVFLIYKKLYLSYPIFFKLETFYKFYLFVPLFIILAQILIMPNESYLTPPPELIPNPTDEQRALSIAAAQEDFIHESEINNLNNDEDNENVPLIMPRRRSSLGDAYKSVYIEEEVEDATKSKTELSHSIFGILHGTSINYQFNSWWFKLICLFSTIQMLRLNYFVATVNSQYSYLLGSYDSANSLNKLFDIALPLGGVISIPFVGLFLDHFPTSIVLGALLGVSLIIGILGVIKNSFTSGVINVLIFVAYRPFFYTSISDYCAKVFGFETFGTVYGSIMTVAGFVNFLQSVLDKLTHTYFKMNPIPLNLLLLAITVVIGTATVAYVTVQSHKYALLRLKGNDESENQENDD
ncbi:hypothetical protein C6P40_003676 [Pichia californica]|uniref:Protein FMP42 n=1 Tax=Pichia californica TaxID=460514 RepID=A0A9P7BD86_9ASCO|nr:hypothetical protein C6P42_003366 [[Candida] californica]KAG0686626.1 hypothetical protein C6P40_003676 [[Candida] californica]